jgi:hypothetical protein
MGSVVEEMGATSVSELLFGTNLQKKWRVMGVSEEGLMEYYNLL